MDEFIVDEIDLAGVFVNGSLGWGALLIVGRILFGFGDRLRHRSGQRQRRQ